MSIHLSINIFYKNSTQELYMKNIFLSATFISMISCHINGSFHRAPQRIIVTLYSLRNCSTTQNLRPEELILIKDLLKQSEVRIIDHIEKLTNKVEYIDSESLKLSDLYNVLPEEEVSYLKRGLDK